MLSIVIGRHVYLMPSCFERTLFQKCYIRFGCQLYLAALSGAQPCYIPTQSNEHGVEYIYYRVLPEFFPLNLHLCLSVVFSHSDQSILYAPPPVTEPLAVNVSGVVAVAGVIFIIRPSVFSLVIRTESNNTAGMVQETNKTVMAVKFERGMGLRGGAPREMGFLLSYRMTSLSLPSCTPNTDQLTTWRFETQQACRLKLNNGVLWFTTPSRPQNLRQK